MTTKIEPAVLHLELEVSDLERSLYDAEERLAAFVDRADVGSRPAYRAKLVFEELVTNALKYGFDGGEAARVRCSVRREPRGLVLEFRDRGRPFNPCAAPAPPQPLTLDSPAGGLGLELVRKVAALDYRREPDENVVVARIDAESN